MPVLFVHGVNVRKESPGYRAGTIATEAFMKTHLEGIALGGATLDTIPRVWFPYWGDLATTFAWDMASLPTEEMEALGSAGDPDTEVLAAHLWDGISGPVGEEPLAQLARQDFPAAVDAVVHLALSQTDADEADAAAFAVAASAYATAHPEPPSWMADVETDDQFISDLTAEVTSASRDAPTAEALGTASALAGPLRWAARKVKKAVRSMAGKVGDAAGDFASTRVLGATRTSLNGTLGRFFGDVFRYLDTRGTHDAPGPIPQRILGTIDEAIGQSPAGEPLVLIGHSLGGVILFDLLGHFRPDLHVDLFVSVGSQVAHFEELKLYRTSDPAVGPPDRAARPAAIRHWINVYDEVDCFAYAADRVFEGVDVDARYNTGTYVLKSHGAYFEQDRFYKRLRARIDGLPT